MTSSCCSGNYSSRSFRRCLPSSGSSCGSSYPSNLVYTTTSCSPSTCQLGSSLSSGCQETCFEPTNFQRSCVVSSPCQMPCSYPRSCTPCIPCQGTYAGSLGFGSSSCHSLGYGSRSCYFGGCRSSGFRSLGCDSRLYYPAYLASTTFQPSCYRSICGSGF
ncbi:keratin-associated protein 13-1-like [Psammomys obesus]|uniref:keratin-associated protein 13-1-like n=1 Tax=Psammomys obesus TaxID=48139 RepID=UPI00245333EE|nr:keratin-associated protein 13-1-like [Psammomys obesus]